MVSHVIFRLLEFGNRKSSRIILGLALAIAGSIEAQTTFHWNPDPALLTSGSGEAQKSYNWTSNADGTGSWPKSAFDDDFTAGSLGSAWTFLDSTSNKTGSASVSGGALTLNAAGKDVWTGENEQAAIYRSDISGDFDVSVKVNGFSAAADPWTKTGILVWNDFKKASSGGGFAVMVTRDNGFTVHYDSIAPVGRFDSPQGGTATAVFPCWLRAVKKGSIFSGYYKTSLNSPWVLLKDARTTLGVVSGGNSQIGLFIASHSNTGVTSTSQMDDFQGGGDIQANNLNLACDGTSATSETDARLTANLSAASVDLSAFSGAFSFLNSTLTVSGNANFDGTGTINAGTGLLALNGSGTQVLIPRLSQVFPAINKGGSGTVQITNHPIIAGKLTLSSGNFDLGSRTNEFAGLAGTGGSFSALGAGDTLIFTDDANFSGLTSVPSAGSIQIRAQGAGKSIAFTPGNVTYNNLYLWPNPASGTANRITVGAGTLKVKGTLFLRDQKTAGFSGIVDFRANNANVAADGDIIRIDEGSSGTSSLALLMGNGTWTSKANVAISTANGGSADGSTLDMAGTGIQILTLTGGSLNKVNHASTGTLQLGSALSAASLAQSGGSLNFNGANLALTGNLQVTNGTSATFIGLGGRTLAVGGNASFAGTAGSLLNLDPSGNWNMQATGKLTADYASIGRSAATVSAGNTTPSCVDALGNTRWNFGTIAPPVLTRQTPDTSVLTGAPVTLSVHATGSGLLYAWIKKPNAAILSTDTLYTIGSAALTDIAQYQCTVSNDYGSVVATISLTVNEPASVSHATGDTSVVLGKPAVFSVSAKGSGTLTYDWYRKGNAASIFSGPVYTLAKPTMADSGAVFYCIVGNGFGTPVQTADAVLSVDEPATMIAPPANIAVLLGQKAAFTVTARGSNKLAYEWHRLGVTPPIPGATAATYTLDPATKPDSGASFYCIISNDFGSATSPSAKLTVNALQPPHDTIVLADQTALFKVSAGSAPTTTFAWYRKSDTTAVIGTDSILTVAPVKSSDDNARFFCKVSTPSGTVTTGEAILTVAKIPVVTREPVKVTVLAGQPATFSFSVSGTPALGFQWKKKSSPASSFVGDTVFTLPAVTVADNNSVFYCIVANLWGRDTTAEATLIVNDPALITREPKDTVVVAGQKAAFTVGSKGTGPLAYAWHRKGDTATLSTDTVYTVNPAALADNGSIFQCIVSNDFGRDTTREAKLTVVQAALIVREPKDLTVGVGRKAVFTVGAIGANPIAYKWRKQGDTTGIGKDSVFTIDSVKLSDNGKAFTVIVSNGFGSDTSVAAKLTVVVCDSLFKVTPESLTVDEGQPVLLAGQASCSDSYLWSAVSGPAPRILDPEAKNLAFNAPRILADTSMVYQFSASYGSATVSKLVKIKVKEAIPDPKFTLKPTAKWNGLAPLVVRPSLANDAALKASKYAPPFNYQWSISDIIADTVQAGDSLSLSHPVESGLLDIHLCLDNGGLPDCESIMVDVAVLPVSLRRAIAHASGPVARSGPDLFWLSSARIRIWTWQGRILWEHRGAAGEMAVMPDEAFRALIHHQAQMEILLR